MFLPESCIVCIACIMNVFYTKTFDHILFASKPIVIKLKLPIYLELTNFYCNPDNFSEIYIKDTGLLFECQFNCKEISSLVLKFLFQIIRHFGIKVHAGITAADTMISVGIDSHVELNSCLNHPLSKFHGILQMYVIIC